MVLGAQFTSLASDDQETGEPTRWCNNSECQLSGWEHVFLLGTFGMKSEFLSLFRPTGAE